VVASHSWLGAGEAEGETEQLGNMSAAVVGRCRLTVSKPVLKAPMVSAPETIIA